MGLSPRSGRAGARSPSSGDSSDDRSRSPLGVQQYSDDVIQLNRDALMLHDEHGSGSDSASGSGTPSRTGSFSQSSRNPSTRGPPSSSAPSSFVRRSSTTSLARHSDATAATAGGNKPSKGSWLSRRGSQSDQFYDVEPLADSGACMRFLNRFGYVFCYMLAQAGNWARSGEILPILNTLASVAFLILLPYQAAFDSTVNFNALYAVGYGLDLIIITYRFLKASEVWPLRTWARELLHGPDGSHKVRKKRSSKRRHRVGDRVGPMGGHTTGSDSDQGSPQHMRRTAMKKGQMNGQTVNGHDVSPGSSGHDGSKEEAGTTVGCGNSVQTRGRSCRARWSAVRACRTMRRRWRGQRWRWQIIGGRARSPKGQCAT